MNKILLLCLCFLVFSCKTETKTESELEALKEAEAQKLKDFFAFTFEEYKKFHPEFQTQLGLKENYGEWNNISPEFEEAELARTKTYLAFINDSIDKSLLDESLALSYDLFKLEMENNIAGFEYRFHNYPVNQMFGKHSTAPAFLINMHKISNVEDAEAYLARLAGIKPMFDQLIENLKIREEKGIVPPKFVFPLVIDASRNVLKGRPFENTVAKSALMEDFFQKVNEADISEEEKERLLKKAEENLLTYVMPAYNDLILFLERQQERATTDDGAWKFPQGEEFYKHALSIITTTDMSSEDIHQYGLDEVNRIQGEMKEIMTKTGFEGDLQDFFQFMRSDAQFYYQDTESGRQKYLEEATEMINTMRGKLDELFITKPNADLVVKAVEPFREKSAGKAFYQRPAIDGSRPGIYYANLYKMDAMPIYQMEALAYHEGIPGHHMQLAIAQELEGIPDFRKFKNYTAYVEGWGLYSEFLPKELGFYEDPYSDFGRLAMELWRACRLVVDTGIHSKKWTREEGINYYKENTPNAESDCVKMVERHIVMPGQATAYKIGMRKIIDLRENAKTQLGEDFDIREFHEVVLTNGSVPLNVLEEKVQEWINDKKKA